MAKSKPGHVIQQVSEEWRPEGHRPPLPAEGTDGLKVEAGKGEARRGER